MLQDIVTIAFRPRKVSIPTKMLFPTDTDIKKVKSALWEGGLPARAVTRAIHFNPTEHNL